MPDRSIPFPGAGQPKDYQIRVRGHLGPRWADWFAGLTISPEANGDTLLTGPVVDQAALHGVLRNVRDLGLPLLSVVRLDPERDDAPDDGERMEHTGPGPSEPTMFTHNRKDTT